MTSPLETVGPRAGASPLTYALTELGTFDLQSAFAHFDGSSAASAFRPALTVRAQNGTIIARVFPTETVAAGDSADVTFAPFLRATVITDITSVGALVLRPTSPAVSVASNNTGIDVPFTAAQFDTSGMWSVTDPTKVFCRVGGVYLVTATAGLANNATGFRFANIFYTTGGVTTGLAFVSATNSGATFFWGASIVVAIQMIPGDYVQLRVGQNSGSPLNTGANSLSVVATGATI